MSKSNSPWLGFAFGGMLAATLSGGFEDTTAKPSGAKPSYAENAKETPRKQEIESPVFLRVKGDTRTSFQYTFWLKPAHYERYAKAYKALRVEAKGPGASIDFNETYDLQKGERAHWRPITETKLSVVKEGYGLRFKNMPNELFIGVFGINDGKEEKIYADKARNSWFAGSVDVERK